MSTRRRRDEEGYTLVEFAIAMTIFTVLMSFVTPFLFSQLRGALRTENQVDLQQSARAALRTMVRELRQASALYSSTDKPSGKNRISFGVDFNADGSLNSYQITSVPLEQITYYLSSNTLFRGRKQGQGSPLAQDVSQLAFTFYGSNLALDQDGDGIVSETELNTNGDSDGNGNPAWQEAELANVTRVAISLTVADDGEAQTYAAEAFLRNRSLG